jgi:hypothetical protein
MYGLTDDPRPCGGDLYREAWGDTPETFRWCTNCRSDYRNGGKCAGYRGFLVARGAGVRLDHNPFADWRQSRHDDLCPA